MIGVTAFHTACSLGNSQQGRGAATPLSPNAQCSQPHLSSSRSVSALRGVWKWLSKLVQYMCACTHMPLINFVSMKRACYSQCHGDPEVRLGFRRPGRTARLMHSDEGPPWQKRRCCHFARGAATGEVAIGSWLAFVTGARAARPLCDGKGDGCKSNSEPDR